MLALAYLLTVLFPLSYWVETPPLQVLSQNLYLSLSSFFSLLADEIMSELINKRF